MLKRIVYFLMASVLLTSCGAYGRLGFFQDMEVDGVYDVKQKPEVHIGKGDKLKILVMSSQPELAAPFNINLNTMTSDTTKLSMADAMAGATEYEVDANGRILFPVLGEVFVEGLTLDQLMPMIADEIIATGFLKDPVVKAVFSNFEILVMGEFGGQMIVDVPSGDINILQLLAKVGGISEEAQRENVWVIRTIGDARKVYSVNLKSRSLFDSPVFYLQQNDIVYALPMDSKMDSRVSNLVTWITTPITVLSTVVSAAALTLSLTR